MAVELDGNVNMRGQRGSGVNVRVFADGRRLKIVSGNELIGDWDESHFGIVSLQSGFSIKAEGEEFILHTEDDVALAEELQIAAASPRLARQIAARHNPDDPDPEPVPIEIPSHLAAIGFALGGALVVLGGVLLNIADPIAPLAGVAEESGSGFWIAFVVGGMLMVAAAFVMSIGTRVARVVALIVLLGVIGVFAWNVAATDAQAGELAAYGFIAGGLVVGVAVLASGALKASD